MDNNINDDDNNGWTPLKHAIKYDNTEIIQLLIDNGADINVANNNGCTLLIDAVDNNNIEAINLLKKHGAK